MPKIKINESDKVRSLYIDQPSWAPDIAVDDFLVAIGVKQSNSVYHVAESKKVQKERFSRFYLKCYKSDLTTALMRDKDSQQLVTVFWYKR